MAIGIGFYIIPVGMVTIRRIVNLNNWLYSLIYALKNTFLGITVSSYGLISQRNFLRFIFIIIGLLIIAIIRCPIGINQSLEKIAQTTTRIEDLSINPSVAFNRANSRSLSSG